MKKKLLLLILLPVLSLVGTEYSDFEDDPLSFDEMDASCCLPRCFFSAEIDYDWITQAKMKENDGRGRNIHFAHAEVNGNYIHMLNNCDGISLGVGYRHNYIGWKRNLFFDEDRFGKFLISGYGLTKQMPCWDWKFGVQAAYDVDHWDFYDHTVYDFTLWGRYSWCTSWFEDFGFNIGLIAKTGIEKQWILPIIGIDYRWGNCIDISLVYPVDISINYHYSDCWAFTSKVKFWNERYRLDNDDTTPGGILDYRNSGIEFGVTYTYGMCLSGNLHVGSTFGCGDLRVADRNDHNLGHNKFGASAYVGGSLDAKF